MYSMDFKEKYNQFRQWQQRQAEFHITSDEEHECLCCGYRFKGNFCPCCAQKAELGRINWKSVHQGVMDIWGLGTRSLLRSVWHLMTRPGYFISEYINGRRQVSFPPVKMMFILAVIYSFVAYWLLPEVFHFKFYETDNESVKILHQYVEWSKNHYSWEMMAMAVLAILPTWLMFRYAPRNTFHTLPQGFFIQVFYAVITIVISFIVIPLRILETSVFSFIALLLPMLYYIVGYKQLFGYGLWGTLWRQGFIYISVVALTGGLIVGCFGLDIQTVAGQTKLTEQEQMFSRLLIAGIAVLFGIGTMVVGFVINLIATRKARREMRMNELLLKKE